MKIIKLDAVNSTNEYLKKYIIDNCIKTSHVVYSFNQTKGKGQRGKTWHSDSGKNLAFSVCFFPKNLKVKNQFSINMLVSLFIINILKSLKIPELKIKWPNDILSGEKKICGILNEVKIKGNKIENIIIGFGININQENFENLPNASSLKLISKINYNLDSFVSLIIQSLKKNDYLKFKSELKIKKISRIYHKKLYGTDAFINFKNLDDKIFKAKIVSVGENGIIRIKTCTGKFESYNFQEIQMILN